MTAQLIAFPIAPPRPAADVEQGSQDVRAQFAQLAAARDTNVSSPYLTMVDGIDRLIAEAGLDGAALLIKSALRIRGIPVEMKP